MKKFEFRWVYNSIPHTTIVKAPSLTSALKQWAAREDMKTAPALKVKEIL